MDWKEYLVKKDFSDVDTKVLLFDYAILMAWKKGGRKPKEMTNEQLDYLIEKVRKELIGRGVKIKHQDTLPIFSFRIGDEGEEIELDFVLSFWDKPAIIKKGFVKVVGGLANWGKTKGDIDVLIDMPSDAPDWIKVPVEFRLGRALPPELSSRVQILYNDLGGPFTSYVEVFDLVLMPVLERRVEKMEGGEVND